MINLLSYDLAASLAELFYGNESREPLEETLRRLLSDEFSQRINGQVYDRVSYVPHVREMRRMVTGRGDLQVMEEVRQGSAIAGRYLFSFDTANGRVEFESHLFSEIDDDGRILRLVEVARQVEATDGAPLGHVNRPPV